VAHRRRFDLLQDFERALATDDQLRLVAQPRVSLADRSCVCVEFLLRWEHPSLGAVSPAEFIPIVEHSTLARPTTAWVLERATAALANWRAAGLALKASMNISAANLEEADLVQRVQLSLLRHNLPTSALEIEVTESAAMRADGLAMQQLALFSEVGIELALDDFGTGYSSLAYIREIPAGTIKIDRAFVKNIGEDQEARSMLRTMVTLFRDLGRHVVAEGVEDADVAALLVEMGCHEAQGFLFARPMELDAIPDFVSAPAASRAAA
jgi:EAL domain-containing protein (putative c-di-GMP-specific phosphodiesterase class I)